MKKSISHANGKQKKAVLAILISDKMDLKIKNITRAKKRTLQNDQRINPRVRHKNCKYLCTLEKTLESPLDCKEIQPVHPKGDQSWVFIGGTDVDVETPILWPPDAKS